MKLRELFQIRKIKKKTEDRKIALHTASKLYNTLIEI